VFDPGLVTLLVASAFTTSYCQVLETVISDIIQLLQISGGGRAQAGGEKFQGRVGRHECMYNGGYVQAEMCMCMCACATHQHGFVSESGGEGLEERLTSLALL